MFRIFLAVFIALLLIQSYRVVNDSGLLRDVAQKDYGSSCEQLSGPVGAEDITIDFANRIAYIGADDRRAYLLDGNMEQAKNGGLWILDLSDKNSQPIPLKYEIDGPFHPHGIALYQQGGINELYVLNHLSPTEHEVDVFSIKAGGHLELRVRHKAPLMISPNDLVVLAQDQFFFSNDHANPRHTLMEKVEDFAGLPLASVVFFDGKQSHTVVKGLRYPNGLALSADGQELIIAETTGRGIKRYRRGADITEWVEADSINLDSGVDNLEWDQQGHLLTGAHPKLFAFMKHMRDGNARSPSEVIRIKVSADAMSAETLMLDMGEQISGSSVAAMLDDTLLVGSVFEPHILRCQP